MPDIPIPTEVFVNAFRPTDLNKVRVKGQIIEAERVEAFNKEVEQEGGNPTCLICLIVARPDPIDIVLSAAQGLEGAQPFLTPCLMILTIKDWEGNAFVNKAIEGEGVMAWAPNFITEGNPREITYLHPDFTPHFGERG